MPDRRDPPPTDEGWYALHDFRRIDWDAWRDTPQRQREQALEELIAHLDTRLAVEDADEGASALYSVLGHEADLLVLHLRPTSAHIGALERQFEGTAFAEFTERTDSFVSVTEASGYSERAREYFEGELDENSGLANYIRTRLEPTIPEATHVCFYPMEKRRDPGQNWYDLSFEERAEHMEAHGDIGRNYGGRVVQMITGAIALDDWEWGVTLWGDDLVDMKDLLYEMRFDPSTSQCAEFGPFFIGRRFPPSDLPAFLDGEPMPTADHEGDLDRPVHPEDAHTDAEAGTGGGGDGRSDQRGDHGSDQRDEESSEMPASDISADIETVEDDDLAGRLLTLGFHEDEDYPAGSHGLVVYSTADASDLVDEVDGMRGNFEHYDSHVLTTVRAEGGQSAVVSIWATERAAGIAEGFLTDLSGVSRSISGPLGEAVEQGTDGDSDEQTTDGDAHATDGADDIRAELADRDVYAGKPHGEDIYALVLYSTAETETLDAAVSELADSFDHYDSHEGTTVYEDATGGPSAVVSLWETERAAGIAADHLGDLPDIDRWADEGEGFATMGMFYTVEPAHREDFVEKFETVGGLLADMDGHRETALLANTDDENDMFIASRWAAKDDAMAFFRSDAFANTVDWGRDILADRPRHVFLA